VEEKKVTGEVDRGEGVIKPQAGAKEGFKKAAKSGEKEQAKDEQKKKITLAGAEETRGCGRQRRGIAVRRGQSLSKRLLPERPRAEEGVLKEGKHRREDIGSA